MQASKRILFLTIGLLALLLGAIGVFVPVLPTTPFVLLASYCFARSSETLHAFLRTHSLFGPMISSWERDGSISRRAKVLATTCLFTGFGLTLSLTSLSNELSAVLVLIALAVLLFIWTRPEGQR